MHSIPLFQSITMNVGNIQGYSMEYYQFYKNIVMNLNNVMSTIKVQLHFPLNNCVELLKNYELSTCQSKHIMVKRNKIGIVELCDFLIVSICKSQRF
jgi:hypothetical protein